MGKEKNAVKSQLERLMMHILKFFIQPSKRTMSWIFSIRSARKEIRKNLKKQPSLKNYLLSIWKDVFRRAKQGAEKETQEDCDIKELDWDTTFNQEFDLNHDSDNDDKPKK